MLLDKHSFNREGFDGNLYSHFKMAVTHAKEQLDYAGRILTSVTSAEQQAYAIIEGALNALRKINFDEGERLAPHDWAQHCGVEIVDDDGWRKSRSILEPISYKEFIERCNESTVHVLNYPLYNQHFK